MFLYPNMNNEIGVINFSDEVQRLNYTVYKTKKQIFICFFVLCEDMSAMKLY